MGKRLSGKHKKMSRDKARAEATGEKKRHKVAVERSKKMKAKMYNRA